MTGGDAGSGSQAFVDATGANDVKFKAYTVCFK